MKKLHLSLACWLYDRTLALYDGTVRPEGIEINYIPLRVEEILYRMLKFREFDVAEMPISFYLSSLFEGDKPFIAIPVFPSRFFRHSRIYVNVNSGIKEPSDLRGKKVGIPAYSIIAAVWIRGILSDFYDVKVDSVTYYTGPLEDPARYRHHAMLPEVDILPKYKKEIRVERIPAGRYLSEMLISGEVDALYTAHTPSSFRAHPDRVARLFKNYKEVEIEYYKKTKIFPIMHTIVIRRDVYEGNRWIARSLYKAFEEAKNIASERLSTADNVLHYMLPWLYSDYEETVQLMGEDYWPYGIRKNYHVIETLIRYMHDQGLIPYRVKPEEVFAPETIDT